MVMDMRDMRICITWAESALFFLQKKRFFLITGSKRSDPRLSKLRKREKCNWEETLEETV
jgi:hypothetical protein